MENKVLEQNLERIATYDRELLDKILRFNIEKSNINLTKTQKDEYNLIYKNLLIHSDSGAEDEASAIVQKINNKEEKNFIRIVYGLGLGYLVDEMSKLNSKIIVYEPNIEILNFVLSIATIDAIFKNNVFLCADENKFKEHIANCSNEETKMSISFLQSYKALYYDDILNILKIAQKTQGEYIANINTLIKMAPVAIYNTYANLKRIFTSPNIQQLKDIYKGKNATALCVSAGPSLKENIEIIKKNRDKFVIFAVNLTAKVLIENGIKPDFIANIEAYYNEGQFKSIDTSEYNFILEGFSHHYYTKMPTKKTFNYISEKNFINPWVRSCLKIDDNLKSLGTVSYTILMSAYLMGFERIILCGQDLAYKNGECYAKGSQYEKLKCIYNEDKKEYVIVASDMEEFIQSLITDDFSREKAEENAKNIINFLNKNLYTVKGQNNNFVPTQAGYALFVEWFRKAAEEIKKENPKIELINSSTGGAQIDGFENHKLEEIVEELSNFEKIDVQNYEPSFDKDFVISKIDLLYEKMTNATYIFKEYVQIADEIISELNIKKTITSNLKQLIKKQDEMYNKIIQIKYDKDLTYTYRAHIYEFAALIEDNFNNIEEFKEMIIKLRTATDVINWRTREYLNALADCKLVILQ